jgi:hypothetical protein
MFVGGGQSSGRPWLMDAARLRCQFYENNGIIHQASLFMMERIDCRLALAAVSFITVFDIKGWIEGIAPVMEAPKWTKKRDKSLG